jgi:hypothetical protein
MITTTAVLGRGSFDRSQLICGRFRPHGCLLPCGCFHPNGRFRLCSQACHTWIIMEAVLHMEILASDMPILFLWDQLSSQGYHLRNLANTAISNIADMSACRSQWLQSMVHRGETKNVGPWQSQEVNNNYLSDRPFPLVSILYQCIPLCRMRQMYQTIHCCLLPLNKIIDSGFPIKKALE